MSSGCKWWQLYPFHIISWTRTYCMINLEHQAAIYKQSQCFHEMRGRVIHTYVHHTQSLHILASQQLILELMMTLFFFQFILSYNIQEQKYTDLSCIWCCYHNNYYTTTNYKYMCLQTKLVIINLPNFRVPLI